MRVLKENQRHMYYSLLAGKEPGYVYDADGNKIIEKVGSDGTVYYQKTGKKTLIYTDPQGFFGNISFSGSDISLAEYGVDLSGYDAVLVMPLNALPITETSILWLDSEPAYKDSDKTIIDGASADFKVLSVKPSLNYTRYILGRLQKNHEQDN